MARQSGRGASRYELSRDGDLRSFRLMEKPPVESRGHRDFALLPISPPGRYPGIMSAGAEEFEVVAEAETDNRGRISLGRAGASPGRRYRVAVNADGVLLLTPVVSIPERELRVWQDPELADRIRQAVVAAETGQ